MAKKKPAARAGFKAPVNTKTGKTGAEAVSTKAKPKASEKAENPKAVTGDNILTEDQTRMVFFNHLKLIKSANADVAEAKVTLRAAEKGLKDVKKLAQSEGTALVDIETALRLEDGDEKVMRAEIENRIKIARWLNIPMGFQLSLLDEDRRPAVDRAFEEGKIAGLKGGPRKPLHDPSTQQYARWLEGYAEGQAVLSKKFKPLEKTDVPQGSKPKTEAAGEKPKTEAAGDKALHQSAAGAPAPNPGAAGQATPTPPKTPPRPAAAAVAKTPTELAEGLAQAAKTPPTPPEGDNVIELQTGGKKTA